jgi:type 1 glutamine amidotransferase
MKAMRVLVFSDDLYHPAATARAGLAPLAAGGEFVFDWIENAAGWDPRQLRDYPVVLLSKSNVCSAADRTPWLAGPAEHALSHYVRAGGGLVAVHSGIASYKDWPAMRAVLGGVFINHPPPCAIIAVPTRSHPLTAGAERPFAIHDEHYHVALEDPTADIFLHTCSEHGVQPAGWTRREKRGRVAVLTPGHFPEVWLTSGFQQLLVNLLGWTCPGHD